MGLNLGNGVKITIIRKNRKTLSLQLKPGEIIALAPLCTEDDKIFDFIESKSKWIEKHLSAIEECQMALGDLHPLSKSEINALTNKAKTIISERVAFYAPKIGVTYNKITIRRQRTRWGSCSANGNLNFNCLLALFPLEIIDSVVVHELCHRKHMNHSSLFYAEVEKILPDYKKCDKWLKDNGVLYMMRLPS